MGIEFELKYRASETVFDAVRQDLPGEAHLLQMQSVYYDTCDGALSARRWTLRQRLENGQSICTLKTPGDGIRRQEWEVASESIEQGVLELCKLDCPAEFPGLIRTGLVPICGAHFTRIAKTICLDDCTIELAMDSGELTGGKQKLPLCELEVELKSGGEEACRAFAATLVRQYGLIPEPASKFQRALALYKGETYGDL